MSVWVKVFFLTFLEENESVNRGDKDRNKLSVKENFEDFLVKYSNSSNWSYFISNVFSLLSLA